MIGKDAGEAPGVHAWRPRQPPGPRDPVAAFGAPFVPAFARAVRRSGFTFLDAEPPPPRLPADEAARYGYGLASFRTGEVTTVARARLWIEAAAGVRELPADLYDRGGGGGVGDPLRPDLEPGGFASLGEALALRRVTLAAIRRGIGAAHTLVLGLRSADAAADLLAAAVAVRRLGPARLLLVPLAAGAVGNLGSVAAGLAAAGHAAEAAPPLSAEALAMALTRRQPPRSAGGAPAVLRPDARR